MTGNGTIIPNSYLDHTVGSGSDFQIYTAGMELARPEHVGGFADLVSTPERPIVYMVGSSTEKDLQGDTMLVTALADMTLVEPGMVIWLNHDYTVPNSVFGSLATAPILTHSQGIADLHLAVEVEMDSPDAAKTHQLLQKGRKFGCSVGCMIESFEFVEDDEDDWCPAMLISHVRVIEWSVVGVPANQRSWVENAMRGAFNRTLAQGAIPDDRLARAVKGLWPRDYERAVQSLTDMALQKHLTSLPPRQHVQQHTILWDTSQKQFMLQEPQGIRSPISHKAVTDLLQKQAVPTTQAERVVAPAAPVPAAESVLRAVIVEPLVTDPPPAAKQLLPEDEETTLALLNLLGKRLGLPAVTSDDVLQHSRAMHPTNLDQLAQLRDGLAHLLSTYRTDPTEVPLSLSLETVIIRTLRLQKQGKEFSTENMAQLQMIHDCLKDMTNGAVCQTIAADPSTTVETVLSAQLDRLETITKAITDINLIVLQQNSDSLATRMRDAQTTLGTLEQAIVTRQQEHNHLVATTEKLAHMPLPRPTMLNRTLDLDPAAATYHDMLATTGPIVSTTLHDALTHTQMVTIKNVGPGRHWPTGVGKGLRPPLTEEQISCMSVSQVMAYDEGNEAIVPENSH